MHYLHHVLLFSLRNFSNASQIKCMIWSAVSLLLSAKPYNLSCISLSRLKYSYRTQIGNIFLYPFLIATVKINKKLPKLISRSKNDVSCSFVKFYFTCEDRFTGLLDVKWEYVWPPENMKRGISRKCLHKIQKKKLNFRNHGEV